MKKLLLGIFIGLILCNHVMAESSVWKVQKDDSVVYIGGTVHLLRQSDYPLPEEYQEAYSASDMLVFEADLGMMNSPETQQKILSKALYLDGSTVEQHLSAETFKKLKEYCEANNIQIAQFQMLKPQIISVMIMTIELSKLGAGNNGVDMFFHQAGKKDNKAMDELETIDFQLDLLFSLTEGREDETIVQMINEANTLTQYFEKMLTSWRKGDVKSIYDLFVEEMKTETPDLYKITFVDRNNNWLPKIEKYFSNQKTEFILVGVGHLVGPDGVIEQLIKKGYKVEKL